MQPVPENRLPTRAAVAVFRCKASLLQLRRGALDVAGGIRCLPRGRQGDFPSVLAESRTPLWMEESLAERSLQLGKVENLRRALRRLDGTAILAGGLFSFWKQIGRATRRRGYVPGRQLREGCLIPAVGGGLCQLSNALYEVALQAGCEIVERHPHSRIVPGSAAARGRDAAIAWNYLDLRFRSQQPLLVEARLTAEELIVRLRAQTPTDVLVPPVNFVPLAVLTGPPPAETRPLSDTSAQGAPNRKSKIENPKFLDPVAHSCLSCGEEACFRHGSRSVTSLRAEPVGGDGRTAYLVEECWPEFQDYLCTNRRPDDLLGIPLDGAKWRQPRYGWDTDGYGRVVTAAWQTLWRSLTARRLGRYGAARLQAQLEGEAALAERLARSLTPESTHVCVAQSLLPFLRRDGHLGGRRFDVLMTRLPLQTLHARLDAALETHPERRTLGEFRAPDWLVEAEREALEAAVRLITPHAGIAALFPEKTRLLDWRMPKRAPAAPGSKIVFPGPTAARKGAYELRAVARELDLEIVLLGSELEGDDFWRGVRTRRLERGSGDWLVGAAAVVQPALVEDKPRVLLTALAAGVPVIATSLRSRQPCRRSHRSLRRGKRPAGSRSQRPAAGLPGNAAFASGNVGGHCRTENVVKKEALRHPRRENRNRSLFRLHFSQIVAIMSIDTKLCA